MLDLDALIIRHELAEAVAPLGLLIEACDDGRVNLLADRLDEGVQGLLEAAHLATIEAERLADSDGLAGVIEDLDALEAESPSRFRLRPATAPVAPAELQRSAAWLARYYGATGFSPYGERKPGVVDHGRSCGPLIASIDAEPLVFFDASSQIATHAQGLNAPAVLRARDEGAFGSDPIANPDSTDEPVPALTALAETLIAATDGTLDQVTFANSGAEANEKALGLARVNGRGGKRLLALRGSFHGRTLLSLHGTWNPVKRAPFEFAGCEAFWVEFPAHHRPALEPQLPDGWVAAWASGAGWAEGGDQLLDVEVKILRDIDKSLAEQEIFAVLAEVMQGEGGDNHATRRFFCALLAVAKRHDVPLIFDEVQTGFGLGGSFFWHRSLDLVDADGATAAPDAVTTAKKAQLGCVVSRWPDPEPTEVHAASAVRGLCHASVVVAQDSFAWAALAETTLTGLAAGQPEGLVTNVRGRGMAWAIDLPSGAVVNRMLAERFWRGYLTYIAGAKTLRFRLNPSMTEVGWLRLVAALKATLDDLVAAVGFEGPEAFAKAVAALPKAPWKPAGTWRRPRSGLAEGYRLEAITVENLDQHMDALIALEAEAYEPARRETPQGLHGFVDLAGFIGHLAVAPDGGAAGFSMGADLEGFEAVDGCADDATFGAETSLYSLEILVAGEHRGRGLGRALKSAQYDAARAAGKRFICGRNKVGGTAEMGPLNASMGAYVVTRLGAQYGEPDGETDYYRISLFPGAVTVPSIVDAEGVTDLAHGVQRPLGRLPHSLARAAWRGELGGPLVTKLSLCNFATPDSVRFAEFLQRLAPQGCDHVLYCSGRDEMVDKGLRALKYNNRSAQVVLSLEGTYVGHTTAAARSVSDRSDGYFDWPTLPHPARVGVDEALEVLDRALVEHGAANVLGLVIEAFGERSGLPVPEAYFEGLEERRLAGLRVILVETATGGFRNGRGTCFLADSVALNPDQVWYYPGGQLGLVFCADRAWVDKPLQLISTWDGDELSMLRVAHHLRWAWRNRDGIGAKAGLFARILAGVSGASAVGLAGFIACENPEARADALAETGVVVKAYGAGLGLLPALNIEARQLGAALNRLS